VRARINVNPSDFLSSSSTRSLTGTYLVYPHESRLETASRDEMAPVPRIDEYFLYQLSSALSPSGYCLCDHPRRYRKRHPGVHGEGRARSKGPHQLARRERRIR